MRRYTNPRLLHRTLSLPLSVWYLLLYTESANNNGTNHANQGETKKAIQRAPIADLLRQHVQNHQQQQERNRILSAPETASIRSHVTAKKATISLPVQQQQQQQQQQRPNSTERTSGSFPQRHSQEKEPEADQDEFYVNTPSNDGEDSTGEVTDVYENIKDVVNTAAVLKVFDDVLTDSDQTSTTERRQPSAVLRNRRPSSQDDAADMLSLAEHARQKILQRRSKESSPDTSVTPAQQVGAAAADHNAAATNLRPVPQQRSMSPVAPQSEQFKQLLAAKAANRRMPEEVVSDQNSRPADRPVPGNRPAGLPRSTSVDAAAPGAGASAAVKKRPPPLKQKTRSVIVDDVTYSEVLRPVTQHRPAESNRQPLPPSPPTSVAAVQSTHEDFDLPPPPEEYANLPSVSPALSRGLPQTTNERPVADWQREIAGKFRHSSIPATTMPVSTVAATNHDLPPPPSGFHDDIPFHPAPSQPIRSSIVGGSAGKAGGSAGKSGGLASTVRGPMNSWSREYVVRWLKTLNMPEHCAAFSAASINGQQLIRLTDDDLYALGVTQFGQRRMLQRAIESRGEDS